MVGIKELEGLLNPKPEKQLVHVDLSAAIEKLSFKGLPQTCWPISSTVDMTSEAAKKREKDKIAKPFVFVDLAAFVRSWVPDAGSAHGAEAPQEGDIPADKKMRQKLDFAVWSLAFDKWAMAAAAAEQLSFASALVHKQICTRLAMRAHLKGRGRPLGVWYDEIARCSWAERSICGDSTFDVETAARARDEELVLEAECNLDAVKNAGKPTGAKAFGKGVVTCYKCGKVGHVASECKQQSEPKCWKCGKSGHKAEACWGNRKRKANWD